MRLLRGALAHRVEVRVAQRLGAGGALLHVAVRGTWAAGGRVTRGAPRHAEGHLVSWW